MITFYHKYTDLSIKSNKLLSNFLLSLIIYKYLYFKGLHKNVWPLSMLLNDYGDNIWIIRI